MKQVAQFIGIGKLRTSLVVGLTKNFPNFLEAFAMNHYVKIGVVAVVAVIIAKRLPVVSAYL